VFQDGQRAALRGGCQAPLPFLTGAKLGGGAAEHSDHHQDGAVPVQPGTPRPDQPPATDMSGDTPGSRTSSNHNQASQRTATDLSFHQGQFLSNAGFPARRNGMPASENGHGKNHLEFRLGRSTTPTLPVPSFVESCPSGECHICSLLVALSHARRSATHPEPHHTRGADEDFFTGEPRVQTGRTCHRKTAKMVIPIWGWELSGQSRADPGSLGESYEQHCTPPFLLRLQGLLTLFTESFASFDHSTSALSVPGLYASLRWIHIALQTAVPSHSTRGCGQPHPDETQCTAKHTGQSPCSVGPFQVSSWHWDHPGAANRSKAHSVCWNPTKADRDKHHASVVWSQESQFRKSLGSCSFIRHYCSNRGCLLFLH
jgi:hypothetical protein